MPPMEVIRLNDSHHPEVFEAPVPGVGPGRLMAKPCAQVGQRFCGQVEGYSHRHEWHEEAFVR